MPFCCGDNELQMTQLYKPALGAGAGGWGSGTGAGGSGAGAITGGSGSGTTTGGSGSGAGSSGSGSSISMGGSGCGTGIGGTVIGGSVTTGCATGTDSKKTEMYQILYSYKLLSYICLNLRLCYL